MTQKSGDVMISFRKGPGALIQSSMPWRVRGADLSSKSCLKLDIVCNTTGTLRNECS